MGAGSWGPGPGVGGRGPRPGEAAPAPAVRGLQPGLGPAMDASWTPFMRSDSGPAPRPVRKRRVRVLRRHRGKL